MPDAPRFAAPGDVFGVSLPVYNRGGEDTRFSFEVETNGVRVCAASGLALAEDASTNVVLSLRAPREPGELAIRFVARGFGEVHVSEIALPVRPAVAWRETAGVAKLAPGETFEPQEGGRFVWREYDSPLGDLARAVEWLADYPHGCLEQTVSRVFPLLSAGGVLAGLGAKTDVPCAEVVRAGVARVASMVRERGFSMWPDVDCAPWDEEVSLYAAHFLVAAEKAGEKVPAYAAARTLSFLERRAVSTNDAVGAYALHTLALAGKPDKDRMLRLYDARDRLSLLSRARLAVAFAETGDRARARTLLANAASPSDVKEASFALAALLETDPSDARILPLVAYLRDRRDRARHAWGTTSENAHALLAIGGYYRFHPPAKGERFVAWRRLDLPDAAEAAAASNGLSVVRRLLTPEGNAVDPAALVCGDRIVSEIEIASADARELGDLVVEDLFAGAFEPIRGDEAPLPDWVMRSDARDDRMLVFSKRFSLPAGGKAVFRHPLRVVSPGRYTLPGVSVEAMYQPALNACSAPGTVVVRRPENVL
jgi:uncharacterized protein YfaS (alpha-2-macroglobulin family)